MQTTPLAKAITTTEGVLAVVLTVALGVAADPSVLGLSPSVAAVCATVTTVGLVAQRALLKLAVINAAPAAPPVAPPYVVPPREHAPIPAPAPAAPTVDELLADARAVTDPAPLTLSPAERAKLNVAGVVVPLEGEQA